jgi:hypothetical protein
MPKDKPDHDQPNAAAAEATGAPLTFTFDDEQWTIPPGDFWTLDAADAFAEIADSRDNPARLPKYVRRFVIAVLGPTQWHRFAAKPGRTSGDLNSLYSEIFAALGSSSGE